MITEKERDRRTIIAHLPPGYKIAYPKPGTFRASNFKAEDPGSSWWPPFKAALEREFGNRLERARPTEDFRTVSIILKP